MGRLEVLTGRGNAFERVFDKARTLAILSAEPGEICLWLANCYGRADFTGNRAAQVNWLSLLERIRWQ
jgi:hypothetical protein